MSELVTVTALKPSKEYLKSVSFWKQTANLKGVPTDKVCDIEFDALVSVSRLTILTVLVFLSSKAK